MIDTLRYRWRPETYDFNDAEESANAGAPVLLPYLEALWVQLIDQIKTHPEAAPTLAQLLKVITSLLSLPEPLFLSQGIRR